MDSFQTFILLMFAAALLVGFAQRIHISYPIALVIGGAAIGFSPYKHAIPFDPHLILVIVLPPLLYYASFGISFREFKHNWKEILSLALGLVIFTTFIVGVIFKWMFPGLPWALAFAFGAIISPPDTFATTTILKRFAISNRLLTILEGESLVNDASALVLYRLAVVALLSGVFSFAEGSIEFVKIVSGGIAVGFVLGYFLQRFSRRYLEPIVGVVFSFTIPYITYILADSLGVSGVLAVVVNGLMGSQVLIRHYSSLRRIIGYATWDIFIILMNCFVFILIGLQLHEVTAAMTTKQMLLYTGFAFMITVCMIIIRLIWVYAKSFVYYFKAQKSPMSHSICPQIVREGAIIGWSGMRGIVSLTCALALPLTHPNGALLVGRSEVIFITFMVILFTLLIPGLTLSSLISWLKIQQLPEHETARNARLELTKVAESAIARLHTSKSINDEEFDFLSAHLSLQIKAATASDHTHLQNLEEARKLVLQEKRKKLFDLWEKLEIDDKLLTQLEHELDLEETHIARAQLN